jgi:hypothetical protein
MPNESPQNMRFWLIFYNTFSYITLCFNMIFFVLTIFSNKTWRFGWYNLYFKYVVLAMLIAVGFQQIIFGPAVFHLNKRQRFDAILIAITNALLYGYLSYQFLSYTEGFSL